MSIHIDKDKCDGCGVCDYLCPVQAVTLEEKEATIDQEKCTECLLCLEKCPQNAIYQILEKEAPPPPQNSSHTLPQTYSSFSQSPQQTFRTEQKIQKASSIAESLFKGIKAVVESFHKENTLPQRGKRMGGRGGKHRRRFGKHR